MAGREPKQKAGYLSGLQDNQQAFRTTLGERLGWVFDLFPGRLAAAGVAQVSPEHIPKYISGKAKPPFELVARVAAAQGVSLDWLATGEGTRKLGEAGLEGYALIPVMDAEASSGHGSFVGHDEVRDYLAFSRAWLQGVIRAQEDKLCVVFNRGDSNAPDINDGDAMLVDRAMERITAEAFYVFDSDGVLLVKMIERLTDGRIRIKARNPEYEPQTLSRQEAADVRVFGRVRWRAGLL